MTATPPTRPPGAQSGGPQRIATITVTPVAFRDRPLLNTVGVHERKDASEDVIVPGALTFEKGAVAVPSAPGPGVELDRDALARMHENYVRCGLLNRDDTGYMQRFDPAYEAVCRRW